MKMNRVSKFFGIAGLSTLAALSALGMGTMNVLADDAQLPEYVMDGTNAERAISDYFVNKTEAVNENSVVIPHMDIIKSSVNGNTVNMYGAFEVDEYVKDGSALKEAGTAYESHGCFTLTKNADGTYTIDSYNEIPDDAAKADFVNVFGEDIADEAFEIYCKDAGSDLWKTIYAEDVSYYAYDNNLGLNTIAARDGSEIALTNVSFSTNGTRTMFAQTDANVRSAGTTDATAFDGVGKSDEVEVTGMANGWARVELNGRTGYISESLLGDTKPANEEKVEEKKEEKKAEKKSENNEEQKSEPDEVIIHDDIERTGYICGPVEAFTGNTITVNGITAFITDDTAISGALEIGDDAKLEYVVGCDASYTATVIVDNGVLPEGEARVSDGRIVEIPVNDDEVVVEESGEMVPLFDQEPEGSEQEIPMMYVTDDTQEESHDEDAVIVEVPDDFFE